jgi:two-component system, NtrC family, sensor kinase
MKPDSDAQTAPRHSDTRALASTAIALESLLIAAENLPFDAGPREVSRALLTTLSDLWGGVAAGVCVVHPDTQAPFVELATPGGETSSQRSPTRLFPDEPAESVVELPGLLGSTLHVAATSTDPCLSMLLDRTAGILSTALKVSFRLEGVESRSSHDLRAQLIQAEKIASFGRFVANVVHELANPLTSIIAYAEYLGRRAKIRADTAEELDRITRITESAQRILGLSRDLIAYARPTKTVTEPVVLRDVIERALQFCDHELSSRGIRTVYHLDSQIPAVRGATGPLIQVFVNLMTNAAHAMEDRPGSLEVHGSYDASTSTARVVVRDDGAGMSPEVLERIFEPFFTTKGGDRGSGLGLVIVREIITSLGGSIVAESEPGRGTSFTIELPAFDAPRSTRRPLR